MEIILDVHVRHPHVGNDARFGSLHDRSEVNGRRGLAGTELAVNAVDFSRRDRHKWKRLIETEVLGSERAEDERAESGIKN